eukprot:12622852-Prorocentrum_lima.AAC.1
MPVGRAQIKDTNACEVSQQRQTHLVSLSRLARLTMLAGTPCLWCGVCGLVWYGMVWHPPTMRPMDRPRWGQGV